MADLFAETAALKGIIAQMKAEGVPTSTTLNFLKTYGVGREQQATQILGYFKKYGLLDNQLLNLSQGFDRATIIAIENAYIKSLVKFTPQDTDAILILFKQTIGLGNASNLSNNIVALSNSGIVSSAYSIYGIVGTNGVSSAVIALSRGIPAPVMKRLGDLGIKTTDYERLGIKSKEIAEGAAEAVSKAPKLLDEFTIAVRNGSKYGNGFKPAVTSAAVDATDMSRVGYGCSSIYQNNPSIVNKVFSSADEYVAFYRKTLTDGYIDELVGSNPAKFTGKDISSIKNEMAKLRARIQKTKDLAKAEGKYFSGNLNEPSFQNNWLVENCAEIWAVRDAILQGSKLENIVLRSVDVKTGAVKPFCDNCIRTFGDLMNSMN